MAGNEKGAALTEPDYSRGRVPQRVDPTSGRARGAAPSAPSAYNAHRSPAPRGGAVPSAARQGQPLPVDYRQRRQQQQSRQQVPSHQGPVNGGAYRAPGASQRPNSAFRQGAAPRPTAQQLYPDRQRQRKRSHMLKRIGACVLALLLVVVLGAGGYALWFSSALNSALSMGADQDASVNAALTAGKAGEPFYMLVLGSDSREGSGTSEKEAESGDNQRSDVMMLLRVDASNKQVTMVSIPRDTPFTADDGSVQKINEAYNIGGAAASIRAVSELTGAPISHYAEVHFSDLQQIVDKVGGVTVDVDIELSYQDALTGETVTIEPGRQTLDGQQAQIFSRARHEYSNDQDAHRQNNVRSLALAIVQKVLDQPIYALPNTVLDLASHVGTDLDTSDIVSLALGFAGGSGKMTVYSGTGPTDGGINDAAGGKWLCYENPEGWAKLMSVVDAGEDPEGLDLNATSAASSGGNQAAAA